MNTQLFAAVLQGLCANPTVCRCDKDELVLEAVRITHSASHFVDSGYEAIEQYLEECDAEDECHANYAREEAYVVELAVEKAREKLAKDWASRIAVTVD